jgi:hypothetical protein
VAHDLFGRQRPVEQKTLRQAATVIAQEICLRGRLNLFGDGLQAELAGHREDRGRYRRVIGVMRDADQLGDITGVIGHRDTGFTEMTYLALRRGGVGGSTPEA